MTYGDGVSDIDLDALLEFHRVHKKAATLTAIQPGGRFGVLDIDDNETVRQFSGKRQRKMADGSMQDSWCWSRKSLTI